MRAVQPALLVAFATLYLVWGSTYLAVRFAVESVPPFLMMGARSLTAGAILYGWGRWRGGRRPRAVEWAGGAAVGAAMFLVGHGGLAWAEQRVPSGIASLFMATLPVWMTVADRLSDRRARITWRHAAGMLGGGVGIVMLVGPGELLAGDPVDALGAAVLVVSAVAWTVGTALAKRLPRPSSLAVATGTYLLGGGVLLAVTGAAGGEVAALLTSGATGRSLLALGYLIVFGSVIGFGTYSWLIRRAPLSAVSTYAFVNPVVALVLGWWLADEPLTGRVALSAALVVTAVVLILSASAGRQAERGVSPSAGARAAGEAAAEVPGGMAGEVAVRTRSADRGRAGRRVRRAVAAHRADRPPDSRTVHRAG